MMTNPVLLITAIIGYALATALIVIFIRSSRTEPRPAVLNYGSWSARAAALMHLSYAYNFSMIDGGSINSSLSPMLVLMSAILVFVYLCGSLFMPIRRMGILVYPFTIVSLLVAMFWGSDSTATTQYSPALSVHILISLVAYCLISIAAIQALLYVYQERQIKNRAKPAMLMALPPLQTMEILLFRLLGVGFVLLTLTLLSGAFFSQQIFGHPFEFKHHTILALLGWMVFGALLYKRVKQGLRGSQAMAWTISGFILIQLGYFGTKIVAESLS